MPFDFILKPSAYYIHTFTVDTFHRPYPNIPHHLPKSKDHFVNLDRKSQETEGGFFFFFFLPNYQEEDKMRGE
jgi:hypothetical protein